MNEGRVSVKKRILLFVSSIFIFLGVTIHHSTAEEKSTPLSSSDSYLTYLNEQANSTDEEQSKLAANAIEQFKNLSKSKKEDYLEALKPENFKVILEESQKNVGKKLNLKLKNNKEVPVSLETRVSTRAGYEPGDGGSCGSCTYRVTLTPSFYLSVFGITTSTLTTHLVYQANTSKALQVYDVWGSHSNVNPAVLISEQSDNSYIEGTNAVGRATWQIAATGSFGFINEPMTQSVKGNLFYYYKKFESQRGSWDWTEFSDAWSVSPQ